MADVSPNLVKQRSVILALIVTIVAIVTFLLSTGGFEYIVVSFGIPPDRAQLEYKIGFGSVAAALSAVVAYLLAARPSGAKRRHDPPPSLPVSRPRNHRQ